MNQICQLVGISKKTFYQSQEPQERLAQKYQALRPVLGRLIEKHPSYGVPRLCASAGRAGRPRRQSETAAQAPARLGTHLASHGRSRPTQEDLGAAGHRRDFGPELISSVTSRSPPVSRCW